MVSKVPGNDNSIQKKLETFVAIRINKRELHLKIEVYRILTDRKLQF